MMLTASDISAIQKIGNMERQEISRIAVSMYVILRNNCSECESKFIIENNPCGNCNTGQILRELQGETP